MVSNLLKVGTYHWIPHWTCTVNFSYRIRFGQPNPEIGLGKWPMANCHGRHLVNYYKNHDLLSHLCQLRNLPIVNLNLATIIKINYKRPNIDA